MKFSEWCKIRETVSSTDDTFHWWGPKTYIDDRKHYNPQIQDVLNKLQSLNKEIRSVAVQVFQSGHFEEYPQFRDSFTEKIRQAADGVTSAHAILKPNPKVPII